MMVQGPIKPTKKTSALSSKQEYTRTNREQKRACSLTETGVRTPPERQNGTQTASKEENERQQIPGQCEATGSVLRAVETPDRQG